MKKALIILSCLIFPALFARSLMIPDWYTSHDGLHQLVRQYRYAEAIEDGHFPVRWAKDIYYDLGYPLFFFSYHLPWLIGTPLVNLGIPVSTSVQILEYMALVMGFSFSYLFFKQISKREFLGLLGAILFFWLPYRFQLVYVRAAVGELFAFSFLPLLFLGLHQIIERKKIQGVLITGLSLSAMVLSHLLTTLMYLPLTALYLLVFGTRRSLKLLLYAGILTIGLTAFYWWPALDSSQIIPKLRLNFYQPHFVSLKQLLYSPWGHGFSWGTKSIPGSMSFQLGIIQWLGLGISGLIWLKKRNYRFLVLFCLFGLSLILMTKISAPIWQIYNHSLMVDFPWRLIGFSAFIATTIFIYALKTIKLTKKNWFILSLGLVLVTYYTNRNHLKINLPIKYSNQDIAAKKESTSSYDEYLPKNFNKDYTHQRESLIEINEGSAQIEIIADSTHYREFFIKPKEKSLIRINQLRFPGWSITPKFIETSLVDINSVYEFWIEKPTQVILKYSDKLSYRLANYVSLSSMIVLIFLWRKNPKSLS
jgi:hypothetical protein